MWRMPRVTIFMRLEIVQRKELLEQINTKSVFNGSGHYIT